MIIQSIRIINYKCFDDFGTVSFGDRMNLVIGQNNSGKSSLLECFDRQRFSNKPHRDQTQRVGELLNGMSSIEMGFSCSGAELYEVLMINANVNVRLKTADLNQAKEQFRSTFNRESIEFMLNYQGSGNWTKHSEYYSAQFALDSEGAIFTFLPSVDKRSWDLLGPSSAGQDTLPTLLGQHLTRSTYVFRAERFGLGQSSISDRAPLQTNARNLATCLLDLQGRNSYRFNRFVSLIREIFPSVKSISVVQANNS